jgi:hypothetical protein
VALGAAAVGLAWGLKAVAVLAFFVGLASAVALAAGVGGEWIRDVSARRFEHRDDRRR